MTKKALIDWLVDWRQKMKGSVSPHNHRKLLQTRTKAELLTMYKRINEQIGMINESNEQKIIAERNETADLDDEQLLGMIIGYHKRAVWESPEDFSDQPFHPLMKLGRLLEELHKRRRVK